MATSSRCDSAASGSPARGRSTSTRSPLPSSAFSHSSRLR
ncbi:unnamed protein product [[Actinomadura] parvosata subsp. kistnae]|nr:unnamed protein product [Actinomadura parvosata subsp. kistnae]